LGHPFVIEQWILRTGGPSSQYSGRQGNPLHQYGRDVTLEEDQSQIRMAGSPQALSALNGGVLALADWLQIKNVASAMRQFCAHPHEALQLLRARLLR